MAPARAVLELVPRRPTALEECRDMLPAILCKGFDKCYTPPTRAWAIAAVDGCLAYAAPPPPAPPSPTTPPSMASIVVVVECSDPQALVDVVESIDRSLRSACPSLAPVLRLG